MKKTTLAVLLTIFSISGWAADEVAVKAGEMVESEVSEAAGEATDAAAEKAGEAVESAMDKAPEEGAEDSKEADQ
jgi:hypothetical protein